MFGDLRTFALVLDTCGYATDPVRECTCSPATISKYQQRISGPLLDRFDTLWHIEVPRVEWDKLSSDRATISLSEHLR